MSSALTPQQARAFYDRLGRGQDSQAFYEDAAVEAMTVHADFEHATCVYEIGCGTGRFAAGLLAGRLPRDCRYVATDISTTMVQLARQRLAPWEGRAEVRQVSGAPRIEMPDGSCDRVVANYVFDLLTDQDMRVLVAEAHRVLVPGGQLCLVSLTHGVGPISRLVAGLWTRLAARWPTLVGGCRPVRLHDHIGDGWTTVHREVVVRFGVPSEVVVAGRD